MRNILIISNDENLRSQLTFSLNKAGYAHVSASCDCLETLSLIYRLNPKLIVIDMELSSEDFINILKSISEPMSQILLFIAPRSDVDTHILELVKKGHSHFSIRPIDERLFLKEVREIIDLSE